MEDACDRVRLGEGLPDEREARRQADAVFERDALQIRERLAGLDLRERPPVVAGQLAPDVLQEAGLVGAEARVREPEDQVGHVVGAVLRHREQQQGQAAPRVVVEASEQSEVDEREAAVGGEQHVPAVRVRVVDAVDRDLVDVRFEELARELMCPLGGEAVIAFDLAPLDALEHEHLLADERPDHLGDDEILVLGEHAGDHVGVVRLLDEVELAAEMRLELVGERVRLQELRTLGPPLEQRRGLAHQREVELDLLLDAGTANLDDHLTAALEERSVHLCDRGGGDRLGLDRDEHVRGQLLGDDALDLVERHRRNLIHELLELLDVHVRQQVGTRREQLAELDVGRPELLERLPELPSRLPGSLDGCPRPRAPAAPGAGPTGGQRARRTARAWLVRVGRPSARSLRGPRLGNASASRAAARETRPPPAGGRATPCRRAPRRAGRRG